jgi:hypothetical protein
MWWYMSVVLTTWAAEAGGSLELHEFETSRKGSMRQKPCGLASAWEGFSQLQWASPRTAVPRTPAVPEGSF